MSSFTPGQLPPPPDPLDLGQPKLLGPLITSALKLWTSQPSIFVVTAALIVVPIEVIGNGVIGNGFNDSLGQADPITNLIVSVILATFAPAMVTATHARSVVALAEKRTLTTEDAFKLGLSAFGAVFLAGLLYFLTVMIGVIAVFVGAIVAATFGVFTTQIVALEGVGPGAALDASWKLVKDNGFWRTLGYLIVLGFVGQAFGVAVGIVIGIVSASSGDPSWLGIPAVILNAIAMTIALSWTALVNTLLYFSWKSESRLRASGQLPPRTAPVYGDSGVSFQKPGGAGGTAPAAPGSYPGYDQPGSAAGHPGTPQGDAPGTPPAPSTDHPSGGPHTPPGEFPYDDIPPRPQP